MQFTIYMRPDGAYVFVPACMQASAEAERLHGPLKFLQFMDWTQEPVPAMWETVMTAMDEHSFVVFQDAVAKYLVETK